MGRRTCISTLTNTSKSFFSPWNSLELPYCELAMARPSWMAIWQTAMMSPRLPKVKATSIWSKRHPKGGKRRLLRRFLARKGDPDGSQGVEVASTSGATGGRGSEGSSWTAARA